MNHRVISRGTNPVSNPFRPRTDRSGISISNQLEEAIIIDVITNNEHTEYSSDGYNVGAIKFRLLNTDFFRPNESLSWAFPIDSNLTDYPLLNEIVYIIRSLNRFYYFKKINVSNRITSQAIFGLNDEAQAPQNSDQKIQDRKSSQAVPLKNVAAINTLGKYFIDTNLARLKHIEGDIIFEGRTGQSIRFGSAWTDGVNGDISKKPFKSSTIDQAPNLLLRVGPPINKSTQIFNLTVEDINSDASSLWLTTDQIVPLAISTSKSKIQRISISDLPNKLDGKQIIINTDRFVVNSKMDKIMGFAATGIHWVSLKDVTLDADQNHITWTSKDRRDRVVQNWTKTIGKNWDVSVSENSIFRTKNFSLNSKSISLIGSKIFIGSQSSTAEPLVLGSTVVEFLNQLINILVEQPLVLVTGAPGSPSPLNPAILAQLEQLAIEFLSGGPSAKILSQDNFTNKVNDDPDTPRTIELYSEGE